MKFEIRNGEYVGTAEWRGPGEVCLQMDDPAQETWFARYFHTEDSFMAGPVECGQMECERPDSSPEAFQRAAYRLAGHAYEVQAQGEAKRSRAHGDQQKASR